MDIGILDVLKVKQGIGLGEKAYEKRRDHWIKLARSWLEQINPH